MAVKQDDVFEFLQNRILTHYPEAMQILKREMPAPRTAIVYPTYVCNQDCVWCEYNAENTGHHSLMTDDQFRGVMADLDGLGVKAVEFCGGGEPTLHPLLGEMTRDLHRRGMSIGLLTNGTKLRGELAEVMADHASYVRVGFDSGTKETFHKVKRPRSPEAGFDAVCENVRNIVALRNERDTKCRISLKAVLNNENYQEVEAATQLAIELGADSVQFKAARLADTELNAEETEAVNRSIAECAKKYGDRVVLIGGADKIDMHMQCWLTPLQLTIDTLGEVFLCCYYRHRKESHSIGNCFQEPLRDLWYNEEHWEKIDGIQPKECNNLDCRFVRYNEIMTELLVNNDAQFEFI